MCARLKPIPPRVIHQDKQTFVFCRKHIKDDEIGVSLREQGSNNLTQQASKVVTRSVQSSFRLCTYTVVVITLIKSRETVWCFLDGGSPLHCVSRGQNISFIVI